MTGSGSIGTPDEPIFRRLVLHYPSVSRSAAVRLWRGAPDLWTTRSPRLSAVPGLQQAGARRPKKLRRILLPKGGLVRTLYRVAAFLALACFGLVVGPVSAATTSPKTVAQAPAGQSSLTGHVTDSRGTPLAGATVSAEGGGHTYTAVTANDGSFSIALPGGIYAVTINHGGFQTAQNDVAIPAGGNVTVNVPLAEQSLQSLQVIGRTSTSYSRTPFNISESPVSTLPSLEISVRENNNLTDTVGTMPGVVAQRTFSATPNTNFDVRGLGLQTRVTIDGHPVSSGISGQWNTNYSASGIFQDVEVVKGAGLNGSIAGESAVGTVNLRTRDFTRNNAAYFQLGSDTYTGGFYNTWADVNFLPGNRASLIVAKSFVGYNGPWNNYFGDRAGAVNTSTLPTATGQAPNLIGLDQWQGDFSNRYSLDAELVKLRYRFSESTSVTVEYLGLQGQYTPQGGVVRHLPRSDDAAGLPERRGIPADAGDLHVAVDLHRAVHLRQDRQHGAGVHLVPELIHPEQRAASRRRVPDLAQERHHPAPAVHAPHQPLHQRRRREPLPRQRRRLVRGDQRGELPAALPRAGCGARGPATGAAGPCFPRDHRAEPARLRRRGRSARAVQDDAECADVLADAALHVLHHQDRIAERRHGRVLDAVQPARARPVATATPSATSIRSRTTCTTSATTTARTSRSRRAATPAPRQPAAGSSSVRRRAPTRSSRTTCPPTGSSRATRISRPVRRRCSRRRTRATTSCRARRSARRPPSRSTRTSRSPAASSSARSCARARQLLRDLSAQRADRRSERAGGVRVRRKLGRGAGRAGHRARRSTATTIRTSAWSSGSTAT